MSEIMKIVDEREMQKTTKTTQRQKRARGNRSYSESLRAKWFCCALMLGFLQWICKASLFFKSNLELALSIVLKQQEFYESKHVAVEYRCLKTWDLLSFMTCYPLSQHQNLALGAKCFQKYQWKYYSLFLPSFPSGKFYPHSPQVNSSLR